MKKIFNLKIVTILLFSTLFWGCKKDNVEPIINGLEIEDNDLVQVTNASPHVPITVTASDNKSISTVEASIAKDDATMEVVATNTIRNLTSNSLNRFVINVPFPLPAIAPSGKYVATVTITDTNGNKSIKTYKINVLNYRTVTAPPCVFPNVPLTGGNNVLLRVTAPANTNGEDLFVSGNFEGTFPGCSDWSGGGCAALKLTKVAGSDNCYYIQLNLSASSSFKITRGSWIKEPTDANNNPISDIAWNNQPVQDITILNWKDRYVPAAITLPSGAIQTGKTTVVVDVNSNDDSQTYYFVKQGANSLMGAIRGIRVAGTTKIAAALPREEGASYLLVKNDLTKPAVGKFGGDRVIKIRSILNPIEVTPAGFRTEFTNFAPLPTTLYITGGATGDGWANANPAPASQTFTAVSPGLFRLSINLTAGEEYLLIRSAGDWSDNSKVGRLGGNGINGDVTPGGSNFTSVPSTGRYNYTVDFNSGEYYLEKE
jgi:hypothetical protein